MAARLERIIDEGKCVGCGLCASLVPDKVAMTVSDGGDWRPREGTPLSASEVDAVYAVCPGVVQA